MQNESTVLVKVPLSDIDENLAAKHQKLTQELKAVEKALLTAYAESAEYRALSYFSRVKANLPSLSSTTFTEGRLEIKAVVRTIPKNSARGVGLRHFMHDSTLNILLTGKLLTDDQKRGLIHNLTDGALGFPYEAPSAETSK